MATEAQIRINLDANKADKSIKTLGKSIDESKKSTMSARAELKKLTQDLMNMDPASKGFQTATQRAGQLRDQIKDTQAVINATAGAPVENLAKGLSGVAQIGIAGAQGLTSAYALFGGESEQVLQTLVKLQALAGLGDTLKAFGGIGDTFAEIKASFSAFGASLKDAGTNTSNYVATAGDLVASGADITNSVKSQTAVTQTAAAANKILAAEQARVTAAQISNNGATLQQVANTRLLLFELEAKAEADIAGLKRTLENNVLTDVQTAKIEALIFAKEQSLAVTQQESLALQNGTSAQKADIVAKHLNIAASKAETAATTASTLATETNTVATEANTVAAESQTIANEVEAASFGEVATAAGLSAAATLGIVAVVAAVAYGVYQLVKALNTETEQSKKNREEHEKYVETKKRQNALAKESAEYVGKEAGEYVSLISALKNTNEGSKERATLMKQINTEYGTTLDNLGTEAEFQNQLNNTVREYIALQYNRFKLEKNKEYFDQQLGKRFKAEQAYNKLLTKYESDRMEAGDSFTRWNQALGANEIVTLKASESLASYRARFVDFDLELRKAEDSMYDSDAALEQLGLRKEQLLKTEDNLTAGGTRYVKQTKTTTKAVTDSLTEIEKFEKRIAGLVAYQPYTGDGTEDMLNLDDIANKILRAETDVNNKKLDIYGTYGHEKLALEEQLRQSELALNDLYLEQELKSVGLTADEKLKIESEYALKRQEILRKSSLSIGDVGKDEVETVKKWAELSTEERINALQVYVDKVAEITQQATDIIAQFQQNNQDRAQQALDSRFEMEQQALEGALANKKISQEQYDSDVRELEQKQREEQKKLDKEAFDRAKRIQIANATIQTAQAVLTAFQAGLTAGSLIPLPGAALALAGIYSGIAASAGIAQIAAIKSQPFTAARGGIVPGNGSGRVDTVNAMLAPGEAVINAESTGTFLPVLNAINQLGGGKPLVATQNSQVSLPQGYAQPQEVRAYVVERDMTEAQSRSAKMKRNARLFRR